MTEGGNLVHVRPEGTVQAVCQEKTTWTCYFLQGATIAPPLSSRPTTQTLIPTSQNMPEKLARKFQIHDADVRDSSWIFLASLVSKGGRECQRAGIKSLKQEERGVTLKKPSLRLEGMIGLLVFEFCEGSRL